MEKEKNKSANLKDELMLKQLEINVLKSTQDLESFEQIKNVTLQGVLKEKSNLQNRCQQLEEEIIFLKQNMN